MANTNAPTSGAADAGEETVVQPNPAPSAAGKPGNPGTASEDQDEPLTAADVHGQDLLAELIGEATGKTPDQVLGDQPEAPTTGTDTDDGQKPQGKTGEPDGTPTPAPASPAEDERSPVRRRIRNLEQRLKEQERQRAAIETERRKFEEQATGLNAHFQTFEQLLDEAGIPPERFREVTADLKAARTGDRTAAKRVEALFSWLTPQQQPPTPAQPDQPPATQQTPAVEHDDEIINAALDAMDRGMTRDDAMKLARAERLLKRSSVPAAAPSAPAPTAPPQPTQQPRQPPPVADPVLDRGTADIQAKADALRASHPEAAPEVLKEAASLFQAKVDELKNEYGVLPDPSRWGKLFGQAADQALAKHAERQRRQPPPGQRSSPAGKPHAPADIIDELLAEG